MDDAEEASFGRFHSDKQTFCFGVFGQIHLKLGVFWPVWVLRSESDDCKLVVLGQSLSLRRPCPWMKFIMIRVSYRGGTGGIYPPHDFGKGGISPPPIKLQNSVFCNGHFSEVLQESVQKTNPLF